jgi:kinesin family protein 11
LSYSNGLRNDLKSLRAANQRLTEEGTRPDVPTGTTPQKKTWKYVDQWDMTQSREALLRKRTNKASISNSSSAPTSEKLLLIDDENSEDLTQKPLLPSSHISRSPTPSTSSRSTIATPHDSPEPRVSSIPPHGWNSMAEPVRPLAKVPAGRDSLLVPTAVPLADSRRKNIVMSRPSRHFVR